MKLHSARCVVAVRFLTAWNAHCLLRQFVITALWMQFVLAMCLLNSKTKVIVYSLLCFVFIHGKHNAGAQHGIRKLTNFELHGITMFCWIELFLALCVLFKTFDIMWIAVMRMHQHRLHCTLSTLIVDDSLQNCCRKVRIHSYTEM